MITALIIRSYAPDHTKGLLIAQNDQGNPVFTCAVLELPWRDNTRKISCIPEGEYLVRRRWSKKHRWHYHILQVLGRDGILQHPGNYTSQIEGCQLPGAHFEHLNTDGIPDIANTRATLDKMMVLFGEEYRLVIRSFNDPVFEHELSPSLYWKK